MSLILVFKLKINLSIILTFRYIFEIESENINKESGRKLEVSILHIINVNFNHVGEYLCHAANKDKNELDFSKITLNVSLEAKIIKTSAPVETKLHQNAQLYCLIEGYPFEALNWYKDNEELAADLFDIKVLNKTLRNMTLEIQELSRKDNGSYTCLAQAGNSAANKSIPILVLDKPQVNIDFVKAIGKNKVYLNWTVNDGNAQSSLFFRIQYMAQGDSNWYYYQQEIGGGIIRMYCRIYSKTILSIGYG